MLQSPDNVHTIVCLRCVCMCALGILNEGSSVSIESTESEEVKEKPNTKHNGLLATSIECE